MDESFDDDTACYPHTVPQDMTKANNVQDPAPPRSQIVKAISAFGFQDRLDSWPPPSSVPIQPGGVQGLAGSSDGEFGQSRGRAAHLYW